MPTNEYYENRIRQLEKEIYGMKAYVSSDNIRVFYVKDGFKVEMYIVNRDDNLNGIFIQVEKPEEGK